MEDNKFVSNARKDYLTAPEREKLHILNILESISVTYAEYIKYKSLNKNNKEVSAEMKGLVISLFTLLKTKMQKDKTTMKVLDKNDEEQIIPKYEYYAMIWYEQISKSVKGLSDEFIINMYETILEFVEDTKLLSTQATWLKK